tara:strand:- start:887 stop:1195 length:309 start_codon:yes stop_codon:yes gene_type:complete
MSDEIEWTEGIYFNPKHENAPDFVVGGLSIERKVFGNWLRQKTEDKINLDIKISKAGKPYISVSTWKPDPNKGQTHSSAGTTGAAPANNPVVDKFVDDDIPF